MKIGMHPQDLCEDFRLRRGGSVVKTEPEYTTTSMYCIQVTLGIIHQLIVLAGN
uniref:Uncharacterized protein n=1 Tax=Rhizophora mucronata TaxID=61149 RepID=A0A2P2NHG4_RHIMU